MNQLQLERWKQLSLGLARSYKSLTPARKAKLLEEVDECIEWVVCNGLETIVDWDSALYEAGRLVKYSAGSQVDDYLWDNRYKFEKRNSNGNIELVTGRFGTMLASCVRAGFDMAVSPSAGVLGFSVGNLRDIFDGAIPDWVAEHFEPDALSGADRNEGVWL